MEIHRTIIGKSVLLDVSGKLDAYWSSTLSQEIENSVNGGAQVVRLDLADVDFISSAGLRVLLIWLKQMRAMNGEFSIEQPSPQVLSILDMSGLTDILIKDPMASAFDHVELSGSFASDRGRFLTRHVNEVEAGTLNIVQPHDMLASKRSDYPVIRYPSTRLGLGIGAFGDVGTGSDLRFGEFLSAVGVTVCLPTDGRNHPDYMMEDGVFIPTISVYSGLAADARFSHSILFEAQGDGQGIALSDLAALALAESSVSSAMLMILAETSFLIGAALRISPVGVADPYVYPEVREQFSFTTEPAAEHTTSLICGVVSLSSAEYLRPISSLCHGHLHAIAFSHRPMPAGFFDPEVFVRKLYDEERIHEVLHLLCDDRHGSTAAESEFMRGSIWVHPLAHAASGDL